MKEAVIPIIMHLQVQPVIPEEIPAAPAAAQGSGFSWGSGFWRRSARLLPEESQICFLKEELQALLAATSGKEQTGNRRPEEDGNEESEEGQPQMYCPSSLSW